MAEDLGEKAFYLAVLLIVLTSFSYWAQPVGVAQGLLLAGGTMAAVISLTQRIGARRKAVGEVEQIEYLEGVHVNAVSIRLQSEWAGHEPGQFAFVTFDQREGAHPFTISSAWRGDGRLLFLIKALGDYTRTLAGSLKAGDTVTVEGPYGRFNFDGEAQRQIWIGGGIGISPFVARLKQLAQQRDGREIDLFHSTADVDETALQRLRDDAQAAGVRLHLLVSGRDERLTGERLRERVPQWRDAEIWFCGPAGFGDAIRTDLCANGLPAGRFHQELFEMR